MLNNPSLFESKSTYERKSQFVLVDIHKIMRKYDKRESLSAKIGRIRKSLDA